jgi:hypothetical protein
VINPHQNMVVEDKVLQRTGDEQFQLTAFLPTRYCRLSITGRAGESEARDFFKSSRGTVFPTTAIQTRMTIEVLFGRALGQTTGLAKSLQRLIDLGWAVQTSSTPGRRRKPLKAGSAGAIARNKAASASRRVSASWRRTPTVRWPGSRSVSQSGTASPHSAYPSQKPQDESARERGGLRGTRFVQQGLSRAFSDWTHTKGQDQPFQWIVVLTERDSFCILHN